jgi:hypothetical protein
MRHPARIALALLIVGSAVAAEPVIAAEVYVLDDGRRLVGTYDPATAMLRVIGVVPASIRVEPETIVSHRPATAADLPDDRPTTPSQRADRARAAATGALAASQRASEGRETMIAVARRRQAEAEARAAAQAVVLAELDAALATLDGERRDVQTQRDHLANQRALTERRITAITVEGSAVPGNPPITPPAPTVTVSELQIELVAVDRRLAELATRLAALDARRVAGLTQRATALATQATHQKEARDQAARIAALSAEQERAVAERERFAAALATASTPSP